MGEDLLNRKHRRQNEEKSAGVDFIVPDSQSSQALDPEMIYWDEGMHHASGIHFDPDPSINIFYTMIDYGGEVRRTLYYAQNARNFTVAMNGKFGKNNKIVLDDETWDRKLIYNVKSSRYKQGLLKMFKDKFKEDKISL